MYKHTCVRPGAQGIAKVDRLSYFVLSGPIFSHTEKALEGLLGFVGFVVVVGLFWWFLFFFLLGNCPF